MLQSLFHKLEFISLIFEHAKSFLKKAYESLSQYIHNAAKQTLSYEQVTIELVLQRKN